METAGNKSFKNGSSKKVLQTAYQEIANFTRPQCMGGCPDPGGCCQPRYCEAATLRAAQCGEELPPPSGGRLPYLGPAGCNVDPWLRPLCAVHVCEARLIADPVFAKEYLALREKVLRLEAAHGPAWPEGLARQYWE